MLDAATLLSVASGMLVGLTLGILGAGGSILALPLLVYVVGFEGDPHVAIGTTALAVAATALFGLLQHRASGRVRLDVGLAFALPGALGALAGAKLGLDTPGRWLLGMFALLMLVVAWRMWPRGPRAPADAAPDVPASDAPAPPVQWVLVGVSGAVVGVLAGYFGIGGGFLIVPALAWAAKLDVRAAMATSLVAVAIFGLTTAARYSLAGAISLPVAALFIAGGLGGALVGARAAPRVPRAALQASFAGALVLVAGYVLYRAV